MSAFYIKKLQVEDASLLQQVALKAYSDHYLHLWYDGGEWYTANYFSQAQLAAELADANTQFFIAYCNQQPAGFLKLNIDAVLPGFDDKKALELERIYLNKEVEGRGIGKEFIQLTVDIAKEKNKEIVWLKAMNTSAGPIAFYEKMGFKIVAAHHLKHALMKEELRGMVVMVKELKQ